MCIAILVCQAWSEEYFRVARFVKIFYSPLKTVLKMKLACYLWYYVIGLVLSVIALMHSVIYKYQIVLIIY